MKKALIILLLLSATTSCRTYLDLDRRRSIYSDFMNFDYLATHNQLVYKNKVNSSAGKDVFYTTHFSIALPKRLKNWLISSNEFFFEYDNKQIIYINSSHLNKGNAGKWVIQEVHDDKIYSALSSYWYRRKYDEDALKSGKAGRVSKVYSDGKVSILLYNIKRENFDKDLNLVKQFKYLE